MERIGAYNIDEIRNKEDLSELENGLGKKHLISLNYTLLELLEEYQMGKVNTETTENHTEKKEDTEKVEEENEGGGKENEQENQ